jgi:hypothetical protein
MKLHPKKPKALNRTKAIAATVAALGAAIGVNMGDVLAATSDMQNAESVRRQDISSQKIKKPGVSTPKVERGLKQRPDVRANKASPMLQNRPNVKANKASPQGLNKNLGELGEKSGIIIEDRPGVTSNKFGK